MPAIYETVPATPRAERSRSEHGTQPDMDDPPPPPQRALPVVRVRWLR